MSRTTLLLEFCKNTGFVSIQPFRGHRLHHPVAVTFIFPEWDDRFNVNLFGCSINFKGYFPPFIQNIQVFRRMQANFGIGRAGFGGRTALPDNQFSRVITKFFVGENMIERHGAHHRNRYFTINPGLIKFSHQQCPFGRNSVSRLKAALTQNFYTVCHVTKISKFLNFFF